LANDELNRSIASVNKTSSRKVVMSTTTIDRIAFSLSPPEANIRVLFFKTRKKKKMNAI
jgi:hypothetical protein